MTAWHSDVAAWVRAVTLRAVERPCIVGICGPQGAGKSTLASRVVAELAGGGLRALAISIDDFYLTRSEQLALAARFPGHRALEHRGYPGTHDVALGTSVLDALREGRDLRVPVYDKSAHAGRGDRAPEGAWCPVVGRMDVVILEGWMLGFRPVAPETLPLELVEPNARLAAYAAWVERLDAFVQMIPGSLDDVVRWRIDAEATRRARGEAALSDAEARDYIERFLPAYRAYLPGLTASPPLGPRLVVALGADRQARVITTHG